MTPADRAKLRKLASRPSSLSIEHASEWVRAANPATVLALLDRIDELEARETRTEWRVVCPAHFATPDRGGSCAMSTSPVERESAALYTLSECQREGHPHARLESRTVTTGRWEVVE